MHMLQAKSPELHRVLSTMSILVAMLFIGPEIFADDAFEIVSFKTNDGGKVEAALFAAEGKTAAVLAHGGVFNKESWYPQAERLKAAGVTALSIDFRGYGNSKAENNRAKYHDVLAAVAYLEAKGFERIAVIGGSMGGQATLEALAKTDSKTIVKAVLLAPAGGDPIASAKISKLFIVSMGDRFIATVNRLHEASAEPKELLVYTGDAHAQHLFKSEHAEDLTKRIVKFVAE